MNLRSIASCAASFAVASCAICAAAEPFDEGRLEKEILVAGLHDSVQLQVAPDGDIYYIERAGAVKVFSPANKATRTVGTVPIMALGEGHMTGIALDPAFPTNGWLYLYFSPKIPGNVMRLSRFTLKEGTLDLRSEKILIEQSFKPGPHFGGGMQFDPAGDLWLSLGDNATGNRTPETDERPGREGFNALRTAANSQDLRGKIIRIHPEPDGTCSIPAGNLFADPSQGRPEIYVMGCRNPYRFFFDSRSGALFWAEVGPNTEERFGTGGYDEISRTTVPGNSGWPLFVGPTTAYHRYDHATDRIGEKYSADRPLNESRLNTGLRELPKPIPALIWYGSEDSKEFPELGNGGRTAMVGFVYRFNPALASSTKLPAHFDGRLFIYEWCRNWIKTVTLDAQGGVAGIHPFLGTALLRRPIDLKLGPDGAIYLIEYGEKWGGNTDGVISRILYRRGNRPPSAVATSNISAGTAPLSVKFSAAKSSDPDGDALSYRWSFGEGDAGSPERESTWTYTKHGVFRPSLTVTDGEGVSTTTLLTVAVGNAPPSVRFANLNHGGFFEWNERIPIEVIVVDAEDGSTSAGSIPPSRVQVKAQYYAQASADGLPVLGAEGGAGLMRRSDCLSCHAVAAASIGPSFLQIAARYRGDPAARARLAEKIINGGSG
ncbi:MAG: PQQ-dependent sugar dehydrogenase, partial [Opitutaceae bacterium]